jgi:hypothetical protein
VSLSNERERAQANQSNSRHGRGLSKSKAFYGRYCFSGDNIACLPYLARHQEACALVIWLKIGEAKPLEL